MMSKKLALFPMTRDMCAMARNVGLLANYNLSRLLVPSYLRIQDQDISTIDGGSPTSHVLTDYNEDKITECDALFVEYDDKNRSEITSKKNTCSCRYILNILS